MEDGGYVCVEDDLNIRTTTTTTTAQSLVSTNKYTGKDELSSYPHS